MYRDAREAFLGQLAAIARDGEVVTVRGQLTRELTSQSFTYADSLARCIIVPERLNNVFAAIAESVWVLAGRNDIGYLLPYLPRAVDFSDDGDTWRGAYGPRIRDWAGVDQLFHVVDLLRADPTSRRAVISIFDPARDFVASKDIPCTNWLHFMVRDASLHMEVVMRSNDIFWGFSGINTFEWSVLMEVVARWLGVAPGTTTYFVSSMHLYERHFARANSLLNSPYALAPAPAEARFDTSYERFDIALAAWFDVESQIRADPYDSAAPEVLTDPLLRDFARMIRVHWLAKAGDGKEALAAAAVVVDVNLRMAALEYLSRDDPDAFWAPHTAEADAERRARVTQALDEIHTLKDGIYGDSWKRRGEFASVVNNVARKADRLIRWDMTTAPTVELFDSVIDLTVYTIKYATLLYEQLPGRLLADLGEDAQSENFSDGPSGVRRILDAYASRWLHDNEGSLDKVETSFDKLIAAFDDGEPTVSAEQRLALTKALAAASLSLLNQLADSHPLVFAKWKQQALSVTEN